jgi:hypothetical protein
MDESTPDFPMGHAGCGESEFLYHLPSERELQDAVRRILMLHPEYDAKQLRSIIKGIHVKTQFTRMLKQHSSCKYNITNNFQRHVQHGLLVLTR